MSDSDDTDVLLLIPPNLFLVPSDNELEEFEKDRSLVNSLVSQVNNLENRVNLIENFAGSRSGSSFDNFDASNDHPVISLEGSDNNNSVGSIKSVGSRALLSEDKSKLLNEIDTYLESVKAKSQKEDKMAEGGVAYQSSSPTKRLALGDVDKLLKEMELTQSEIENKLKMRETEYGLNDKSKLLDTPRKSYLTGDNIGSVPDLGYGVREMFSVTPTTSPLKGTREPPKSPSVEEPFVKRDAYLVGSSNNNEDLRRSSGSSFNRSPKRDLQSKLSLPADTRRSQGYLSPRRRLPMSNDYTFNSHTRSARTLENKLTFDPPEERNGENLPLSRESEMPFNRFKPDGNSVTSRKPVQSFTDHSVRGNLLSLADLWRSDNSSGVDDPTKLRQKLEEEKYRRLHLEETIQTLNKRVLEEQEKLAVAMKVDEGKDKAIGKITDAWKQMVEHWKEIEAERHAMSQKIISEKMAIKKAQDDISKKIERWEKEISQALDLAAGFKSKCEYLETELSLCKEASETKIKELEDTLFARDASIKNLTEERTRLAEKLLISEQDYEQEKKLVEMARQEVAIVQQNLNEVEGELVIVKEQKDLLSTRLKEEKGRNQNLEQQKHQLQESLAEAKTKQNAAEEAAKSAREQLELAKTELRSLYQDQLESVVRDKLAEFQAQLDSAQSAMQEEIENTKRISEQKIEHEKHALLKSHDLEIRKLETRHKEEMKKLQLKLTESERRRLRLENGKKDIAQKLHGVMETQWQQALNIITSELSMRQAEPEHAGQGDVSLRSTNSKHTKIESESVESDEAPSKKEPGKSSQSGKQDQLLRYIQMLLEKQPGKPIDSSSSQWHDTTQSDNLDGSIHDHLPWHQVMNLGNQPTLDSHQQNLLKKPPWK